MATTGSSSSAATPDDIGAAAAPSASVDLLIGLVVPSTSAIDMAAYARDVAHALLAGAHTFRWQLAFAHTADVSAEVQRVRNTLGMNGVMLEVPFARQPIDALDVPYHGLPGRARGLHAIFREAQARGARGCVILDPHSAAPALWLEHLLQPLITDVADCVTPVYNRHPFAGALVHGLVYPMFRALYGLRVRYPLAADIACSRPLIDAIVPEDIWETSAGQFGIDLWLAATAASGGFRMAQAALGPRIDEPRGVDVSMTVSQVVGTLFADMESRAISWQRIRDSRAPVQFGDLPPSPDPPDMDIAQLADSFRLGSRELQDVWAEVLPPLAILQWRRLAASPLEAFRVDEALWARTVYDFAVGHRQRAIAREHLLAAFTPLYLGWLASFVLDVQRRSIDAESHIERLCLAFESEKPYLISQWRWPERFRPIKRRRAAQPGEET